MSIGCLGLVVVELLKDMLNFEFKFFFEFLKIIELCIYNLNIKGYLK